MLHTSIPAAGMSVLLVAACTLAPAFAADTTASRATPGRNPAAAEQARASVQAASVAARNAAGQARLAARGAGGANESFANPYRAYPPSCLNNPLALQYGLGGDPNALTAQVVLFGDPVQCLAGGNANECNYFETDTVTLWRVPCSGNQSAVLLEIDRPANLDGISTLYPTIPGIYVAQGNKSLFIRFTDDPNTFFGTTFANSPLIYSNIYVLENFFGGATQFDYDQAFTLFVDNFSGNAPIQFPLGAYNKANYAAAALALPISGYMSTNWFDPNHSGEGILVQVYDNGDNATRTFTAAWYTFDGFGLPFWLYAQGTINIGDRSTGNVDTFYATNGGFAGNFGATATFTKWGTINVSFPDCSHMSFSYVGNTDAQTNGPGGSGTRSGWIRLANINSLTCE
jgi:hypothetical protein